MNLARCDKVLDFGGEIIICLYSVGHIGEHFGYYVALDKRKTPKQVGIKWDE